MAFQLLKYTVVCLLLVVSSCCANAAIIVDYNIDALSGSPTSVGAASSATGVTPISLSVGLGLNPISISGSPSYFGANGWDSTDPDDYFEFGFTVQSGYVATLTQVSLSIMTRPTGPQEIGLYLLTGTSGTPVQLSSIILASDTITPWTTSVSISGLTSSARLRLIEVGNKSAANPSLPPGSGSLRLFNTSGTNIQVLGNVTLATVPEPSHGLLLMAGLFAWLRRRKSKIAGDSSQQQ